MTLPSGVRVSWRAVAATGPRREVSRALLSEMLPGAVMLSRCARCGGEHGRIRVTGVEAAASVSYAPGWAVVAVADGPGAIGVDAAPAHAQGLDRVLPGADARAWARTEAVLKADGRGLEVDPARVHVVEAADGRWTGAVDAGAAWEGYDLVGPPGVVVAVAVRPPR